MQQVRAPSQLAVHMPHCYKDRTSSDSMIGLYKEMPASTSAPSMHPACSATCSGQPVSPACVWRRMLVLLLTLMHMNSGVR
jgi:hypothetical protein